MGRGFSPVIVTCPLMVPPFVTDISSYAHPEDTKSPKTRHNVHVRTAMKPSLYP
jgi:hypothetical protein